MRCTEKSYKRLPQPVRLPIQDFLRHLIVTRGIIDPEEVLLAAEGGVM